jgi:hypothetical protein
VRVGESPDFYVPLSVAELPTQDYWQIPGVTILGRLNPGVSIAQAQLGLDPFLQEVEKTSTLPQIERDESFAHALTRFLLHLLPEGCVRIRSFGFLANRKRATLLPLCFHLLGSAQEPQAEQHASSIEDSLDIWRCPNAVDR